MVATKWQRSGPGLSCRHNHAAHPDAHREVRCGIVTINLHSRGEIYNVWAGMAGQKQGDIQYCELARQAINKGIKSTRTTCTLVNMLSLLYCRCTVPVQTEVQC